MTKPTEEQIRKAKIRIAMSQKIFNPDFNLILMSGYNNIKDCDEADKILKQIDEIIYGKQFAPCILAASYLLTHLVALNPDKWNKILDQPIKERIENYIG